ncbi:uncharacterized protein PHALS_11552 [Plasmopara halstedii]|uniref:Uncharacterized protein n=1 Tax=Plasmopara halstedii TaxID=4781 RepID=A0A0P1AJ25_PLAHL|nr:uncharacterized protein PHALS_11552 [Plasmopara halstedii]CEG41188.1 hypothetical protein PHALS_11552 [Plasmopara halstedii]|eukprot:XP_024577557.1 hypothetical protein PHALS_11552 [Plasmopara halstedii]
MCENYFSVRFPDDAPNKVGVAGDHYRYSQSAFSRQHGLPETIVKGRDWCLAARYWQNLF